MQRKKLSNPLNAQFAQFNNIKYCQNGSILNTAKMAARYCQNGSPNTAKMAVKSIKREYIREKIYILFLSPTLLIRYFRARLASFYIAAKIFQISFMEAK